MRDGQLRLRKGLKRSRQGRGPARGNVSVETAGAADSLPNPFEPNQARPAPAPDGGRS